MDIFYAMSRIDDAYIVENIPEKWGYYEDKRKKKRYKRLLRLGYSAALLCIALLCVNIDNAAFARNIPIVGGVFGYLQDTLDFSGNYVDYADSVNEKVKSNGITAEITEVYCDGANLFVAYRLESEKPFTEYTPNYIETQINYNSMTAIEENPQMKLSSVGINGLEGSYIDEYTFMGVELYSLYDECFPDDFHIRIAISSWNLPSLYGNSEKEIRGSWRFYIPVSVNKEGIEVRKLNVVHEGHSIDEVIISPVMITVKTTCPDGYGDTVRYAVLAFSDQSDENIVVQGRYDAAHGIVKIGRNSVKDTIEICVVDYALLPKDVPEGYTWEMIRQYATVVSAKVDLQ